MKRMKDDFSDIIEKKRIKAVYQPIVSLRDGKVIGYEALSRIINPKEITDTEELFVLAGMYGKIWELEQLCRIKILEKYSKFKDVKNTKIFLNVNPRVIHENDFHAGFTKGTLKKYGISLESVVYEITERNSTDDLKGFKDAIKHYKDQGYTIAIDDAGSCYSGLNLICDLAPHYLKLDMALIRGINEDYIKKAMVKSLVEFADLTGSQLIAEGIETEEELITLLKLGVHNGQGYFLAKPNEELIDICDESRDIIKKFWKKKQKKYELESNPTVEYRTVLFHFENNKAYYAYCDKYGDKQGDNISKMLKNTILMNMRLDEQIMNIGADGFLVVFKKDGSKSICENIINTFNAQVNQFYTNEDFKKGYIEIEKKNHELKKYPLVKIQSERVV